MSAKIPAANPHVAAMSPYVPGEQPQGGGWVKLNTNENPYPPSLRSLEAIRAALVNDGANLRLYPSPDSAPLREAAARFHGFDAARVVAGNGSDDILNLIIRAYAGHGRPIGMLNPSYSLYPVLAAAQAADVVKVEVAADLGVESLRPIVGAAEGLPVEPDDAVIIGGGLQQRLGRDFLQFEGGAEPDFLFRDVVLRAPDPGSLRRGDDGTEAKDGQAE